MAGYSWVTTWRFDAPIERVWDAIYHYLGWPGWWPSIKQTTRIVPGDGEGMGEIGEWVFRTRLPYAVRFFMTTTNVRPPHELDGRATGPFEGTGRWRLSEEDGGTLVRFYWDVNKVPWWMHVLSPIARPVFNWNHDQVMRSGESGLRKLLRGEAAGRGG